MANKPITAEIARPGQFSRSSRLPKPRPSSMSGDVISSVTAGA
jgi:hypothetical protein